MPNGDVEVDDIHAMMRKLYPCRLVERDGEVVGGWVVTSAETKPHAEGKRLAVDVEVKGFMRTPDGVVGLKERMPLAGGLRAAVEARLDALALSDDPEERGRSHEDFCECVRVAAWQADFDGFRDGKAAEGLAMSVTGTMNSILRDSVDQDTLRTCVRDRMDTVSLRLAEALDALDPDAVSLLLDVKGHDRAIGAAWAGMDRGYHPDAPLVPAIDQAPGRITEILAAWRKDLPGLLRSLSGGDLDEYLTGRLAGAPGVIDADPTLRVEAARAVMSMPASALDASFGEGASADRPGCVARTLAMLDGLDPRGGSRHDADWKAFVVLVPLLEGVGAWSDTASARKALLPMPEGAAAALAGLRSASSRNDPAAMVGLLQGMAETFAREIAYPAACVAGKADGLPPPFDPSWLSVSRDLLFSGRPLHRCLEAAHRWHSARKVISTAVAAIDANSRKPLSWAPGIPDGRTYGLAITVAKSDEDLRRIADTKEGLGVDVVTTGRACAAGTRRVLLVEDMDPEADGTRRMRSCHLVGLGPDGIRVIDHRAREGADPDARCVRAVMSYVAAVGPAYAASVAATVTDGAASVAGKQAYDATRKAWDHVCGLWRDRVGGRFEWATPGQVTAAALAHAEGLRPCWSEEPFRWADPALKGSATWSFMAAAEAADLSRYRSKLELSKAILPAPGTKAARHAAIFADVPAQTAQDRLAMMFEASPFKRGRRASAEVAAPSPGP